MAREKGYIATVKMFIPVNPKSLDDTVTKATALHDAQQKNDLSGLAKIGAEVMSVEHRFTSRTKAEQAVEHGSAETVEEIVEEAHEDPPEADVEGGMTEEEATQEIASKSRRRAA